MNFEFVLDENYLAFFILNKKMFNEINEINEIKNQLLSDNDLGYRKITEQILLDSSIYLNDEESKQLINEFINNEKFDEIYKAFNSATKEIFAIKVLTNKINLNSEEIENIKDILWNKYLSGYKRLFNISSYNPQYFFLDADVKNTINIFKDTKEYKQLYEETKIYLDSINNYWNKNKDFINNYLKKIIKEDFDLSPIVYISHPNTCVGYSFDNNKIAWGHYKGIKDPNYNLTYLVHEGLHCLIPYEKNDTKEICDVKHSIIELISDYELYSRLKNESTFEKGHSYLDAYKKIIYPYWLRYINLNNDEIETRIMKDKVDKNLINDIENIDISKMNINQFIDFCLEKCIKDNKYYIQDKSL